MKKAVIAIVAAAILAALFLASRPVKADAVMYKSPYCGCCEAYASYLRSSGISVRVEVADMERVKERYGIAENLRSCHTVVMNGKVIEGHVPLEAVQKLMESDEKGIALPGMPAGSPGMPGVKAGEFVIYGLDGRVFDRI